MLYYNPNLLKMVVQLHFNAAVDHIDIHLSSRPCQKISLESEYLSWNIWISLQRQSWQKAMRTVNNLSEWACAYL